MFLRICNEKTLVRSAPRDIHGFPDSDSQCTRSRRRHEYPSDWEQQSTTSCHNVVGSKHVVRSLWCLLVWVRGSNVQTTVRKKKAMRKSFHHHKKGITIVIYYSWCRCWYLSFPKLHVRYVLWIPATTARKWKWSDETSCKNARKRWYGQYTYD